VALFDSLLICFSLILPLVTLALFFLYDCIFSRMRSCKIILWKSWRGALFNSYIPSSRYHCTRALCWYWRSISIVSDSTICNKTGFLIDFFTMAFYYGILYVLHNVMKPYNKATIPFASGNEIRLSFQEIFQYLSPKLVIKSNMLLFYVHISFIIKIL